MFRFAINVSIIVSVFIISFCLVSPLMASNFGLNKFDLFTQYLGTASGGNTSIPYTQVTSKMGNKSIQDAAALCSRFVRVSVTGYGPHDYFANTDLYYWKTQPAYYWQKMDHMMDDLDKHNVQIVPVFLWNWTQFPSLTKKETFKDLITNTNSESYKFLEQFISEFVIRYKDRKTILFYELTNELSLLADLDNVKRCKTDFNDSRCTPQANFTTQQMIQLSRKLSNFIKTIDTTAKISYGHSLPRASAESLRQNPEWSSFQGLHWVPDTKEAFEKNLSDVNEGADIVSVHQYNTSTDRTRFGMNDNQWISYLTQLTDTWSKELFVGEFGAEDPDSEYPMTLLTSIALAKTPYSAPWVFEFYQNHLNQFANFHIEPGYSDIFLKKYNQLTKKLHTTCSNKTLDPLRVVITTPFNLATVPSKTELYVVASSNKLEPIQVQVYVNGKLFADLGSKPPYKVTLNLSGGASKISVVAKTSSTSKTEDIKVKVE